VGKGGDYLKYTVPWSWLVKNLVPCYVFSNFDQLLGIYFFPFDG